MYKLPVCSRQLNINLLDRNLSHFVKGTPVRPTIVGVSYPSPG